MATDKEKIRATRKRYRERHKERLNKEALEYAATHSELLRVAREKYKEENKEKIKAYAKTYGKAYKKDRRKTDPVYRMREAMSSKIGSALRKSGSSKRGASILKFLPYSIKELKAHLESMFEPWMTWENHGCADPSRKTWQIDHIIPQSLLPYSSMEDDNFKRCWALENLRPLESTENLRKSNKIPDEPIGLKVSKEADNNGDSKVSTKEAR